MARTRNAAMAAFAMAIHTAVSSTSGIPSTRRRQTEQPRPRHAIDCAWGDRHKACVSLEAGNVGESRRRGAPFYVWPVHGRALRVEKPPFKKWRGGSYYK